MRFRELAGLVGCLWLTWLTFAVSPAAGQHTVSFSNAGAGETKAITEWGADTAWPSSDNMRQNITHMGVDEIDVVRVNFYVDEALQSNGEIGPRSRERLATQLSIAAMCGDKPLALTPNSADPTDASYLNGTQVNIDRWVQLLEATHAYLNRPIHAVEPFNEPDYWPGQGTPQNLRDIMTRLLASERYRDVALQGASTLNADAAQSWYDVIAGPATHGTTHLLGGSANSYAGFIQHVKAAGDLPYQPELHSLAEAIYGAEYGLQGGIWWGAVQRARGLFVRNCQGKRLGYAEDRGRQSAAAVYRAPSGELRGFAGCFERGGSLTPYRFVSTDRDVWFNGIGPLREFMLSVTQGQDAYVDIDTRDSRPPLDGSRWRIVNTASGLSLLVANASRDDGGDIRVGVDSGADNERWDITRSRDGYYVLRAAHSGKAAEVADWALNNGANIRQWGTGDNFLGHWFMDDAGDGAFFIRNAHTTKYMTSEGDDVHQWESTSGAEQRWRFELADPAASATLTSHYELERDATDSTGAHDGTTAGGPQFDTGAVGEAIVLDGTDDFVTLPDGIASSQDITVAAWVYWDGGANWQRVFDFGNNDKQYLFLTPSSGDGTLRFGIKNGGDEEILETDTLAVRKWTHLAITLQGNTGIMYVDGRPRVAGQILQNPSDIRPGKNYIGESQFVADPLFKGMIDDLRIYDHGVDARTVADLAGLPPDAFPDAGAPVRMDASVPTPRDASVPVESVDAASFDGGGQGGSSQPKARRDSSGCSLGGRAGGAHALLMLLSVLRRRRAAKLRRGQRTSD